jgi:hypothetical protein
MLRVFVLLSSYSGAVLVNMEQPLENDIVQLRWMKVHVAQNKLGRALHTKEPCHLADCFFASLVLTWHVQIC